MSENLVLGPKAMTAYTNMVENGKFKYLIYKIDEAESEIVPEKDGHSSATYDDFLAALPKDECRWGLCEMDLGWYGSLCSFEPVFFTWLPDAAPASQKALYEQSREILTQGFDQVMVFHTVANLADLSHEAMVNRMAASGPPRQLELPEGEFSIDRLAPKMGLVLRDLWRDSQSDNESYGHAIFKLNRYLMYDVAQTGDPASSHDEFLAGLPTDDCRWGLYTLDIRSLTADSGPDARSTFTFFFSWIPKTAPADTRGLYYEGSDGTAMGDYDAQFSPTGIMRDKVDQIADYFMGEISDHAKVSYQALMEAARRIFKPTDEEKAEDEQEEQKLRQEAKDEQDEDRIRQGEVQEGGIWN